MAYGSGANDADMIAPAAVTVVVNGAIVSSTLPAFIFGGHVVAPLVPIVVRLVSRARVISRAAYDPSTASVAIDDGAIHVVVPVAFVAEGQPYVELGAIVRAVGGSLSFDGPSKTLAIALAPGFAIVTPRPYDPSAPQVAPTTIFTPSPPPPTPRSVETGLPRPRRTAIPVHPSEPTEPIAPPTPQPEPTSPRR